MCVYFGDLYDFETLKIIFKNILQEAMLKLHWFESIIRNRINNYEYEFLLKV